MRLWIQRSALALAIVLTLGACASDDGSTEAAVATTTTTSPASPATTGVVGEGGDASPSTTAEMSDPPPPVEGPAAPDFTFALADGSDFSLRDEQKPVYLVFWAEW